MPDGINLPQVASLPITVFSIKNAPICTADIHSVGHGETDIDAVNIFGDAMTDTSQDPVSPDASSGTEVCVDVVDTDVDRNVLIVFCAGNVGDR